jgi:hypothetical protein
LIITFGRSSRRQSPCAWAIVACASSARSGVHSKDTYPSWISKNGCWVSRTPVLASERSRSLERSEPVIASAKVVGFDVAR